MTSPRTAPWLIDGLAILAAPTQVWCRRTGDMGGEATADGVFHADWCYLRDVHIALGAAAPTWLATRADSDRAVFTAAARNVDDETKDPRVTVRRQREVSPGSVVERIEVHNASRDPIDVPVEWAARVHVAPLHRVRAGDALADEVGLASSGDELKIETPGRSAVLTCNGGTWDLRGEAVVARWRVRLSPGERWTASVAAAMRDSNSALAPPTVSAGASLPPSGIWALDRWADVALADLRALRLSLAEVPDSDFAAAGAPWYLTLFGRDALWSARMMLPIDPALVRGTLRALAAHQGRKVDQASGEAPGKILHELRSGAHEVPREGIVLPPVYFGSVDATALWVCTLHDWWQSGADREEVRALLPALRAALDWLVHYGDADGDGFIEYVDRTGHGLANQGWKDSSDALRFRDGTVASGPTALVEVQGYSYEAAMGGARLLDEFGEDGADDVRSWATRLRRRFRESFWVERDGRRFPAVALDGKKRLVDSLTSNIGHLLGTGLLDPAEESAVVGALMSPAMLSGFGLRTIAGDEAGYWPLSYHCGSVWAHDTAIALMGLERAGYGAEAQILARQLVVAAEQFDFRMPELFGVVTGGPDGLNAAPQVVPYPTTCVPQAWSSAAVVPVARVLTPAPEG